MTPSPFSVLVVDDSAFMRKIISDFISEDPQFRVVDTARNGREAVDKIVRLQPDAVTMDVEMPEMNGLEALRETMVRRPTPIIMLSSLTSEGTLQTIQALELGAFDFVAKPSGSISLDLYKVKQLLLEKLHAAVRSRNASPRLDLPIVKEPVLPPAASPRVANTQAEADSNRVAPPGAVSQSTMAPSESFRHLVAIGTSTGGPRALHRVLSQLPVGFPAPVFIVQHMPPAFTRSLAQRLDGASGLQVVEAEDGMPVKSGYGYVAPGGWHMVVHDAAGRLSIRLTKDEPRSGHRPSVDRLFESLLPLARYKRHVVIMTGMGSDGAKTMTALRAAGAETTIAEAEETCVVYGMPRAAVEARAAMFVLAQPDIAPKLIQVTNL